MARLKTISTEEGQPLDMNSQAFDLMTAGASNEVDIIGSEEGKPSSSLYEWISGGLSPEEHRKQTKAAATERREIAKEQGTPDIHNVLLAGGFTPGPVGAAADILDAFLYVTEGKLGQAALSGLSVLPFGSILFRGVGGGKRLMKSFEVAGKRVPREMAEKHIDEFGELAQKGFHEDLKLVGGVDIGKGEYTGVWGEAGKKSLHVTTSVAEAARTYGEKILRLDIDDKILRQMMDDDLLLKVPAGRPGQNISHLIFKEGLSLKKISDLELFNNIEAYIDFMRTNGYSQMQINKIIQQYWGHK